MGGEARGRKGVRQAGERTGEEEEEEGGGRAVTCLEYQSTEETKPFQEVRSQGV